MKENYGIWAGGLSKHTTSAVTKPFPLLSPNAVAFHPVSLANGLSDTISAIAVAGPTAPTTKLPLNAVSPRSQTAIELAKLLVKTLLLVRPTLV
jgi:hypothetical protein